MSKTDVRHVDTENAKFVEMEILFVGGNSNGCDFMVLYEETLPACTTLKTDTKLYSLKTKESQRESA